MTDEVTIEEAKEIIETQTLLARKWEYLYNEEKKVAEGFRDLSIRYKELLDKAMLA